MIKVIWDDQAKAHTDHNIDDFLDDIILGHNTTGDVTVYVGQELIILSLCNDVKLNIIDHTEIMFYFKDEPISIDKNGVLSHIPEDFCDAHNLLLLSLSEGF